MSPRSKASSYAASRLFKVFLLLGGRDLASGVGEREERDMDVEAAATFPPEP